MQKQINVPEFLQEFHGKRTSLFSIILVYLSALIVSAIISLQFLPKGFPAWKTTIFVIVVMDIAGGVIANFTNATKIYYQDKPIKRILFLSLHIIHPLLFMILFPKEIALFTLMGVYTLLSSFILNVLSPGETQRLLAVFFVTVGITIVFVLPSEFVFLKLLPILFFLKLILGFSVKKHSDIENN